MSVPIKTHKKKKFGKLPITLYQVVCRWVPKTFINLENQQEEIHDIWEFRALNYLNPVYENGRKRFSETYKFRTLQGNLIDKRDFLGKVYGFEALSDALSALGVPISPEKVEELVKDAVDRQIPHAKFCTKSSLIPCSPDQFKGKNEWLLLANYPSYDEMCMRINEQLKANGSPLRIKSKIKTKLVEV